jgi:hypothetical protein
LFVTLPGGARMPSVARMSQVPNPPSLTYITHRAGIDAAGGAMGRATMQIVDAPMGAQMGRAVCEWQASP